MNIKWKLARSLLLSMSMVITTSCTILATPTPEVITNIVKETVIVTATPVPPTSTPEPNILFTDDFSHEDSGWSTETGEVSNRFYKDGTFHIEIQPRSGRFAWSSHPELEVLDDFMVEVDTKQIGGEDNLIGIMFRYQNSDNNYIFVISDAGNAALFQYVDDELDIIVGPSQADHINSGNESNHIKIIAEGSKISAYVNGELTFFIYDDTFSRGDINLFAGSLGGGIVDATFDNIVVTKLE